MLELEGVRINRKIGGGSVAIHVIDGSAVHPRKCDDGLNMRPFRLCSRMGMVSCIRWIIPIAIVPFPPAIQYTLRLIVIPVHQLCIV